MSQIYKVGDRCSVKLTDLVTENGTIDDIVARKAKITLDSGRAITRSVTLLEQPVPPKAL